MLKNVLTGGFLLLMIGALVVGGISLFDRSEDAHAWQGPGRDERNVVARGADDQVVPGDQGRGRGGQGHGANDRTDEAVPGGQGGGRGGQGGGANVRTDEVVPGGGYGRGQGQDNSQPSRAQPQAEVADWQTVEGVVVETTELVIETADGQTVQVGLGPSHYRESQGFVLQVGDRVRVSGYPEHGEFKAGQVENLDTGESIVLRDTSGRPMWAGQGNRKNAVSYNTQTQ